METEAMTESNRRLKHTPGPWKRIAGTIQAPDYGCIAIVQGEGFFSDEQLANARLIAASPQLLEACQALLDAFEGYEMMAALDYKVQDIAHAAIAAATGEVHE